MKAFVFIDLFRIANGKVAKLFFLVTAVSSKNRICATVKSPALGAAIKILLLLAVAPVCVEAAAPLVESSAATDIGITTATLNGNITSDGGETVTDRGFVYKSNAGVTIDDNKTPVSGMTGSYTLNLSSLDVNAPYYFKAYAINSAGTTLSTPELSFWTFANTPAAPIVQTPAANGLNVAIGTGDGNPSNTSYAVQETNSGNYLQLDGSLDPTAVYQTASDWGITTVTGLNAATMYGFQVKAINGVGVETDFGPVTTAVTAPAPVGGTASPALSVVCSGSETTIELSGHTGVIMKWQSSADDWVTTNDIASTDNPLNTGPLTAATAFRAVVQSGEFTVISSAATVAVDPASVGGTATPTLLAVCSESGTTIQLSGQTGAIVKWQSSTDNWTTTNDIVSTDNPLSTGPLTSATAFRAVVQSGACAATTSSVATVAIEPAPAITTDVTNQTACVGANVTWSVVASGNGLSYQWQRDGTNLLEGVANFTGTTNSTLTNSAVGFEDSLPKLQGYVCVVSGICSPTASSTRVSLTVDPVSVGGTASPALLAVCSGSGSTIELSGQTGAIVKWQSSIDNWATTNDIVSTDNPLSTGPLTSETTFRAVVQSGACTAAISSLATVTVDPGSVGGTASPALLAVCSGSGTTIGLSGQTGAIVKWQSSTDNWTTTNEIASTDNPLSTGPLTVATKFRAVVKSGVCAAVNSSEALVSIDSLSAGATFTAIACNGGTSTVTVTATGGTEPYTGTGQFSAPAGHHNFIVSDMNGCTATASVDIPAQTAPPLVVSAGPNREIYAGTSALIGGSPTASGGLPPYLYQWSPTNGLNNGTLQNCIAAPSVTTEYTVTVTDSNGCMASASATVVVSPKPPHEPLGPSSRSTPIVFSEIMYEPAPRLDGNNVEFIEVYNSNPWFEDIGGYRIVGDSINFTFAPGTILPANAFLVIAASPSNLQTVYGITNVLGPYTGDLKKSGTLQLLDEQGAVLLTVEYSNVYPWPVAANGTGHSIILANPTYGEGDPRAWSISDTVGGSPGKLDTFHPSPLRDVVINEVLAHSENPAVPQFVELYNHSTETNDLSGCILTDDPRTNKFVIPAETSVGPGGFISFTDTQLGFRLSGGAGTIYFIKPDGSRMLDALQYEAQADGISVGRWPDGADAFYLLASRTDGTNNSDIRIGDIVINELMYHPISEDDDEQYIELFNKGTNSVNLGNWKFVAGVTYTFPANTMLDPNSYLVIARKLTTLLARHPSLTSGNAVGNYSGRLSHGGERVVLAMPQTLIETNSQGVVTTNTIYVVEDEVTYGTGGRWGKWADGKGTSLELIDPRSNHRLPSNWADSDETQKSSWVTVETTGVLDNGMNYEQPIQHGQIGILDEGECLVDDIEVRAGTNGPNLVANSDFETNLENWSLLGDHVRSTRETPGYSSSHALRMRNSDQMWTGVNSCQFALNTNTLAEGQTATLRFKARWLRGWPEPLLRINGNWLETTGALPVPSDLGTPGAVNSQVVTNAGPAIYDVRHAPTIPAAGEAIVVTARAHDPEGVQSLVLNYRLDPATSYTTVTMKDDGTGGDALSGDGLFSATIPGQSSNSIVAFYIAAADGQGATTSFPAPLNDNSPVRECVVMFGDPNPPGSFGVYHFWVTQTNFTRWTQLLFLSNEPLDCTMVNGSRVIYNAGGQFQGSPAKQDIQPHPTPTGALCNYKWTLPDDDPFLGATSINPLHQPGNAPGDDPSLQREQAAGTLLRALGQPWMYRRFVVVYVNGNRRGSVMEDAQRPNKDIVEEHFSNDPDGFLYKMGSWFEFASQPDSEGFMDYINSPCNLMLHTTTGGVKKTARYRYHFQNRRTPDSVNNYTNVFALVDAANSYGTPGYVTNMENVANMENWMRTFAANHAAGNWDSFGALSAQNMYSYFGVQGTKCTMLNHDFNIAMGNWRGWGPGEHLFEVNPLDPNTGNLFLEPVFRRMYLRALKELVNGPLDLANSGPPIDARYKIFVANGFTVEDPAGPGLVPLSIGIKTFITAARNSIASQVAAEDTTNFTSNLSIVVSNDVALVSGMAPVHVKTIFFNGIEYPIAWTTVTNWSVHLPLQPGTNQFSVVGIDIHGQTIPGATDSVSAVFEPPSIARGVVINEIMYNPGLAGAEYVELYNTAGLPFDLSGYQLLGLSYTFPPGSVMQPASFLVLAANPAAFATAYGAGIPVFDTFTAALSTIGQTLSLVDTNGHVVTQVRYQNTAPWPTSANGTWASVQLVDPLQDNWRAGNWSALDPNQSAAHWSHYTATGTSSSSTLYIYPLAAGDFYIDDLKLVSGSTPEVGANVLANGDFESAFPGPWGVSANLTDSALTTTVRHSGSASLHVVGSSGGSSRSSSIYQDISPELPDNQPYSLSFWCLPGTNPPAGGLVFRLSGSGIVTNINPLPPDPSFGLFTPGKTNSVAATLPTFPPLWLNELQADNLTGITNQAGQRTAWLELYNPTTNTVSLQDLWLANTYSNLAQWPFPTNASISPGEFKVIFADGLTNLSTTNELHANFTLASGSGSLALSRLYNGQLQVLDFVDYTNLPADYSYGSFPNGQSFERQSFFATTAGGSNVVISLAPLSYIPYNEAGLVYLQNFDTLPNPGGQSVNSANPVTINGITYSLTNPFGFASPVIPSGNVGGLGIASLAGWYGRGSVSSRFGATSGDQTTGGILSFGLPNNSNRALGLLATSSTGSTAFGAKFVNGTGRALTRMTLQIIGEVWRQSDVPKSLQFYYWIDPTAAAGLSTNYTAFDPTLNVSFPTVPAAVGGVAVDGDSSVNQTNLGVANQLINWPPGAALWLVWQMVEPTARAQGLGIDDLSFSASDQPMANPVSLGFSSDGTNVTFSWPTLVGQQYQLEYNDDLGTTNWIPFGAPIEGTGKVVMFTDNVTTSIRFFRLRFLLP